MEKLDLHTPDFVSENIEKLASLFPHCVTESADGKKIDFDLLQQELSDDIVEGNRERYRLEWPGKREAIVTANLPTTKTLRPVREDSVDFDNTENLYIEGDNLEVLKLLQESYLGKIKMIYIDPPYNTGNDFVYKDNFSMVNGEWSIVNSEKDEYGTRLVANPESSGRYHSDWLTMMYPRLKLARNLLTDDGVIFISIDDNEIHNLKKICDEVFGEVNFIAQLVLITGANQSGEGIKIQTNTEYCIVYAKDTVLTRIYRIDKVDESLRNLNDAPTELLTRPDMGYTIYFNPITNDFFPEFDYEKDKIFLNVENLVYTDNTHHLKNGYIPLRPGIRNNKLHRWRWGFETFIDRKNEIIIGQTKSGYSVSFKQSGFNSPKNILNYGGGTLELKNLFNGDKYFDFPKGIDYLSRLISIGSQSKDIIFDFFSGSATTAHAVMQLNAEDGGNRKYIMVQLPELTDKNSEAFKAGYQNICEIGKERIRRAAKLIVNGKWSMLNEKKEKLEKMVNGKLVNVNDKYTFPEGIIIDETAETLLQEINHLQLTINNFDTGFRVYRLDTSNMQDVYYRPQDYKQDALDLFADNIKPDRTADDLLAQVMLDWGLPLSYKIEQNTINGKQVFRVAQDSLLACFDKGIDEDFAKIIAKEKPLRIVFRDSGFANDTAKINVQQLLKQLSPETEMKVI